MHNLHARPPTPTNNHTLVGKKCYSRVHPYGISLHTCLVSTELTTLGSSLFSVSEYGAQNTAGPFLSRGVAIEPVAPMMPPLAAPCLFPRPERSESTRGSRLLAGFDCVKCVSCVAEVEVRMKCQY